jgi:hypothetical protein
MSKEWFLECLANPWIFNSVTEFQSNVQDGGIIEDDGHGKLLFINKETLQLEEGESCFKDGLDVWKIAEDEDHFGLPDETIERIINHFSDDKRQLIGVLWFNR